jgi:hypothetical membrane protein
LSKIAFLCAALLAIAGILTAIYGIAQEHFKPTAIGLILIFGSGVFATLYLGTRPRLER